MKIRQKILYWHAKKLLFVTSKYSLAQELVDRGNGNIFSYISSMIRITSKIRPQFSKYYIIRPTFTFCRLTILILLTTDPIMFKQISLNERFLSKTWWGFSLHSNLYGYLFFQGFIKELVVYPNVNHILYILLNIFQSFCFCFFTLSSKF